MEGVQASTVPGAQPPSGELQDGEKVAIVYWCSVPITSTVEDSSSEDGQNFRAALKITANNLGSPVWWGRTAENPDVVIAMLSADKYSRHKYAFQEDPQQAPWRYAASTLFLKVCTDYPKKHHIALTENPSPALEEPTTLLALAFFNPDDAAEPARAHFEETMLQYNAAVDEGTNQNPKAKHQYLGWSKENDLMYASFDGIRKPGSAYYMISGWPSIEAAHSFQLESNESTSLLLNGGADGWRLIHVQFEKVVPDV